MIELIDYGPILLILCVFPLMGLIVEHFTSKRQAAYILSITGIVISPIIFGYSYIFHGVNQILGIIFLGCIYSFFIRQFQSTKKIVGSLIFTFILFLILGLGALLHEIAGTSTVVKNWEIGRYKIEMTEAKGFAGGGILSKYELSKYALIPICIKVIDTKVAPDSIQECNVLFEESKLTFNRCNSTINASH